MSYDIYCYGMISPSTVFLIREDFQYPHPNEYAEIKQSLPSVGGEAVNSAIILSKLGIKIKLDGNWLNPARTDQVRRLLEPFNIDISRLTEKPDCGTEEIVIADTSSRTVFGNYASFHAGEKQWNSPCESDIRDAKFVVLDPYFRQESLLAAEMCAKHKKPFVTLDCRYDSPLAKQAEAVIISHELRGEAYPDANMKDIFKKYQENCKGLIIFTFGSDNLWIARQGQPVHKFKPYQIKPVDTTGAGDAFRGGIAYGLFRGWKDEKTVDFASAVAACVCLTVPHTLNAPDLDGILTFMDTYHQ
ncbi:carbohydrate kinase family protein [bacterium]|nr:carbohydrate kinase family protein [bacterium]